MVRAVLPDTKRGSTWFRYRIPTVIENDRLENDLNKDNPLIHFQLPTNNNYES